MSKLQKCIQVTRAVMIFSVVALILYDIAIAMLAGDSVATISGQFGWLTSHFIYGAYLPAAIGALAMHLLDEVARRQRENPK